MTSKTQKHLSTPHSKFSFWSSTLCFECISKTFHRNHSRGSPLRYCLPDASSSRTWHTIAVQDLPSKSRRSQSQWAGLRSSWSRKQRRFLQYFQRTLARGQYPESCKPWSVSRCWCIFGNYQLFRRWPGTLFCWCSETQPEPRRTWRTQEPVSGWCTCLRE